MKPSLNRNIFFNEAVNPSAFILLIEFNLVNTFMIDNEQGVIDSLKTNLLQHYPDLQVRTICNLTKEGVLPSPNNIPNFLHNTDQPLQNQKIAFPQSEGYEFIAAENILYCNAEGAYTHVHLTCNKKFLISRSLGNVEEMLPFNAFQRIHHSTIVNLQHVTNFIRSDGGYVIINNGEKLMVSKARKDKLLERLGLKKD
jgi:two-component system LytT family response regulator